ncbi:MULTISPECIES: amidase [Prauserella salsuginis group]|uniref:Aspartyl-tRNA(Asn)/glutamyl-tRNA(Gln) amidotransferase subunit A n=2 Tax=Prauserella salsuginis group TaxID=2893672 RepID=A0A839XP76_9PSEU|nr:MULTISPECIES: amidase [Prauserella salsuginis group]MBB3662648.1 aspartyl-tRNA(Asn)/glutamyl-tRNA(Gln) amidotransferase subunit A [Prauserella sediminis]MCR3720346.1 aspartyl-tRNA(Asn)/glutamyl-tRNA(Gln) amidotransferase subunit A [Prauserella flava]MCR3733945.1 aspartyl-tRNA(Asn)/glutamyl-tRNA(Gln) amidotransferase subunit A [Prauserella salsuginis]
MTGLPEKTATELISAYRTGEVSPVEVTEAVLARIDEREPQLHALYAFDPDTARESAAASEQRWRAGTPLGPIDGVPLTIKENIATRGTPKPLGTAATRLEPAPVDAPAAARIRESGGVLLSKTTMPDFGMLTSGVSSFHEPTRNPWDLTRTSGGSSAGAGAAAAAGYGPLHVGTDIGGSIRLPAAWCGIVGFKPSFGRVPVDPPFPGRTAGPMTRTVADAALFMRVLSQPDARDHLSLPPSEPDWSCPPADPSALRIGVQLDPGVGLPVEPAVRDAVAAAARRFEAAGATVELVEPWLTREMLDGLDRFWRTRLLADLAKLDTGAVLPYLVEWARAAEDLSAVDVYHGFAQMDAIAVATLRATEPYDIVLSPTCQVSPNPFDTPSPTGDPARPFEHIAFTLPYNMSGQPAVSVDCGRGPDGLPIGLQLAGRRFADVGTLRAAAAFETL